MSFKLVQGNSSEQWNEMKEKRSEDLLEDLRVEVSQAIYCLNNIDEALGILNSRMTDEERKRNGVG